MFYRSSRILVNLSLVATLAAGSLVAPRASAAQADDALNVNVTRKDDIVKVKADFAVDVSAPQAFAVLTDYDHMRDFLPGVAESKVIQRSGNRLVVSQKVRIKVGFIPVPLDSVRQVDLEPPYKLVSQALSGSVSKAQVITTLTETQGKTVVTYESEATMNSWMPSGLGTSIIGAHVREQLSHMRAEMLRRQGKAAKPGQL